MARGKKVVKRLSLEEKLQQALVPVDEQPYPIPENWCWEYGASIFMPMEAQKPRGEMFRYIDIDSIDNKQQVVSEPKEIPAIKAPSRASRKLHNGDTIFWTGEAKGGRDSIESGLPRAAEFQMDVQVDFLFGAVLFDHDFVQDRGDQGGVNAVLEGEFLFQGGADFLQLLRRPKLGRRASRPAFIPVDPALPDLFFSLGAF